MAIFVAKNVVKETTATTGTGTYVLAGAVSGYDPFSLVGAGSKVAYKCEDAAGTIKEIGIGTVSVSPNQLTRDEILRSPSGSAVNWAAGTKTVTLVGPAELLKVTAIAPGPFNGRLAFVSATQIALQRYLGANLPLVSSGVWRDRQIPSAGVTLSNATMAASTEYNIYAFWNVSAIGLEFSTTAHAKDADTGIEIKSGDSTRLLVGRIRTNASSQFADSATQRFVISWLNPIQSQVTKQMHTVDITSASTTFIELNGSASRGEFISFGEDILITVGGHVSDSGGAVFIHLAVRLDGAAVAGGGGIGQGYAANVWNYILARALVSAAEGYHYISPWGTVGSGTGTWVGGATEQSVYSEAYISK